MLTSREILIGESTPMNGQSKRNSHFQLVTELLYNYNIQEDKIKS